MIRVIADSTCNLTSDVIDKYDILIVPLTITINGETFIDYETITPDELYNQLDALEKLPSTAAPSPDVFVKIFEQDVLNGIKDFIVITMSSGTSAVNQSANIAKDIFLQDNKVDDVRIHVVDSKSMSHGSGYLVLKTCMLREDGVSFEDLVEFNETYKTRVKHFLSVGDLNNLMKSGRLSQTGAIIGKLLHVEPIMTMKNGRGAIVAKIRGKKKVLKHYVDQYMKRVDNEMTNFIIIGYTSIVSYANDLKVMMEDVTNFGENIYIMQMGATVGTHVGLGGVSMYFIEKPKTNHYTDLYNDVASKVTNTIKKIID